MATKRIQFQPGLSMPEFLKDLGTGVQCEQALDFARWQEGFHCPRCDGAARYVVSDGTRKALRCNGCRHYASLVAGIVPVDMRTCGEVRTAGQQA